MIGLTLVVVGRGRLERPTSPTTTNTQTGEVEMEDGKSAKPKCTHCRQFISYFSRFIGWLFIVHPQFKNPMHLRCALKEVRRSE